MIFGTNSNYMLKYEKSKSKLVEFNIAEENYPHYPSDPDDLTYTTLFVLSRYCEEMIENPSSSQIQDLKAELVSVSQYYDTTVKTQFRQEHSRLFLLLGSTSYFLSENFGSAKVLLEQIDNWPLKSNIMTLLYATLRLLLTGEWVEVPTKNREYSQYLDSLKHHFELGASTDAIFEVLRQIRTRIYNSTNVMAVSYVDFLFTIVICAIEHSAWILLPEYSSADIEQWRNYLSKPESIKLLWPAQKVIIQAGVLNRADLVVPLPTGVGKTKSIEILLRAVFMREGSHLAVIIAPLRALCNEITTDLNVAFADDVVINQFTDTNQEDFIVELLAEKNYVFICTPEKFSYILRHEPDFLTSIQLFIFDEAHLFDDASRGTQYELLVSEIARSRQESAQMVLFSAVLSNANQIGDWLFANELATIDYSLVKSTEKSIGFLSSDQTIHYYEKDDMTAESFYVPKSIEFTQLQLRPLEKKPRLFPEKKAQDIAIYFANKLCPHGGAAIYAGQVRSIPPIMRRIIEISERGYDLSNMLVNGNADQVEKLSNLFALHYGATSELTQASKLGAFPHYANLPNGIKLATEHALRKNHIAFVVCTTTLAEGVNIPIKYLFLTTFSLGTTSVQIRKMQNLVGRTARSGIHTEGSAIITDPKYFDNRMNRKTGGTYRWTDCKKMFDYGNTEACMSAILSLVSNLFVDYNTYYNGNALSAYFLENYGKPDCFSTLKDSMQEGYRELVSDDNGRYDRYCSEIEAKTSHLKHVIENIENYLCYIFNSQKGSEDFIDIVEGLVTQTFAYHLGSDEQKQALIKIFRLIAQKIASDIKPEKAAYYAKSLYGLDVSNRILNWLDENIGELEELSNDQLLASIIDLFTQLFPDLTKSDADELITVARLWISGESYSSIFNAVQKSLNIRDVEKLCSNTLSYNLCFLVGNVIDAIGGESEELSEQLALLQKMIKYGVPSRFQMLICENLFDDRVLAQQLDDTSFAQTPTNEKELKGYMAANQQALLKILRQYPDYFSYKFRLFIRRS